MDTRYLSTRPVDGANISRRLSVAKPRNGVVSVKQSNIDKLLDDISVHFKELLQDDANTLETALALMDSSSIGKARYHDIFDSLKENLQNSLKSYVDANYQGFNSSIGSYRTVVQCISNSQGNIDSTQELIIKAKSDLATRRPILKELRSNSLKYQHMIEILDLIDDLKSVPDKLELEIAQKQFLSAHNTLSNSLRTIVNEDLSVVGGLQPLQNYLSSQESSLFSILIEELSNHLYLKSPYCDTRWSAYSQGRDEVSSIEQLIEDKVRFDMSEESLSFSGSALLDEFLTNFDKASPLSVDNHIDEESSFNYIRLVVETLGRLNKLPSCFDLLQQRLPLELSKVIDKTVSEVRQSAPKSFVLEVGKTGNDDNVVVNGIANGIANGSASANPASNEASSSSQLFSDFDNPNNDARLTILKDLVWTLYSKFIAILQGHRVVYEVVSAISSRLVGTNQEGLLSYDYYSVLIAIHGEIISLMKSYISHKKVSLSSSVMSKATSKSSPLKQSKISLKNKTILKFNSSDPDNRDIKNQYQLLKSKLEDSVPGLVINQSDSSSFSPSSNVSSSAHKDSSLLDTRQKGIITSYAPTDLSSRHSLLITPNVLNIRALLEPTVVFLQRAKVIHPYADRKQQQSLSSSSTILLDDFLTKTYLPQLEESLKSSFHHIMTDPQSFQVDPHWPKLSKRPIFQGATSFIKLIRMACKLLNTGYMYREKYAALLISAVGWLNDFYLTRYNEFVESQPEDGVSSTATTTTSAATTNTTTSNIITKKSALLVSQPKARSLASKINLSIPHTPDSEESIQHEIALFLDQRFSQQDTTNRVKQSDLLHVDCYRFLSLMATSLRWIALELEKMRKVKEMDVENEDSNENSTSNLRTRMKKRWTLLEANSLNQSSDDSEYLTLSGKSLQEFDNSLKRLIDLAETCVFTLRFDLRFRCVYFIDRTMIEGDYNPDTDLEERDSFVGLLDANIVRCDEAVGEALVRKDRDCIIRGLAKVLTELLIYGSDSLKLINDNGVKKMYCNILVLQQMLKSIAVDPKDVDFTKALAYYGHLRQSPAVLIDRIKNGDTLFRSEENKVLCRLLYQEIIHKHEQANRRDAVIQARKAMKDHLMEIHSLYFGDDRIGKK